MGTETLSIRLDAATRRFLDEEAVARKSGASTLAREIIEERVTALRHDRVRAQVAELAATMAADPDGDIWGEIDFYPADESR